MSGRTPRMLLLLPEDLLAAIDDHRFANRIETRAEAIRRLIRRGLEAGSHRPPDQPPAHSRSAN